MKKSEIKFEVETDENNLPTNILWEAADAGKKSSCKSAMIAIWDSNENNTLRIDLWTKDMSIDEMKKFYHQNLLTLTETYIRATSDQKNGEEIKAYIKAIGLKMGVLR